MNLDFVNILILDFLAIRVRTVHILLLHSARFALISPTFLSFKLESCNLVCRREFGFREHSYTVIFGN